MSRFKSEFDVDELNRCFRDWIEHNGNGRDKDDIRFGQYLCNHCLEPGANFPELFYEEAAYYAYVKAYNELKIQ